jgi:DMSO/TMAO reductase YedYZ molybdopterin-dependent catalytic subunit
MLPRTSRTSAPTRRALLKQSLALAGLGIVGLPAWMLPALAADEQLVPFADMPEHFPLTTGPDRRLIDVRAVDGPFTPAGQFFTMQHYGHPEVDTARFRLAVSGLVDHPLALSLDDLHRMGGAELVAGFECSGNRPPLEGLVGNGRWTGLPLEAVLHRASVRPSAQTCVFFGADHGSEDIEWRTQKFTVDQHFGRSLARRDMQGARPFLAYALNGEPLTRHQGAPLRLIVPGWYGVANVKWLSRIHLQEDEYLGKYQARWYRTLEGRTLDGETEWIETAVTRMRLKSFVARVTRSAGQHTVSGVVLNDGTPLASVEVRVDHGPWQKAAIDPATRGTFSWKLFTWRWMDATPGTHTIVSRVTDVHGTVQPTADERASKKTFLEDNAQVPRTLTIV